MLYRWIQWESSVFIITIIIIQKKKKVNEWSIKNCMWFLVRSLLHLALLICEVLRLKTICNFESKRRYVHLSFKYNEWALVAAFLIYEVKIKCTWLHQSPMIYVLSVVVAKSISSSFFKFLYCLEGEQLQLHLPFTYLLFQIHFPTDLLSFFYLIKILSLHYFFILSLSFLDFYIFQISNGYIFKGQNLCTVP